MKRCVICNEDFDDEENCGCGERMTVGEWLSGMTATPTDPLERIAGSLERIARVLEEMWKKEKFS